MSEQIDQLAGVLVSLAVVCVCLALALSMDRARIEGRLRRYVGGPAPLDAAEDETPRRAKSRRPLLERLPGLSMLVARPRELARAGLPLTPEQFLGIQALAGLAGLVLARPVAARFGLAGPMLLVAIGVGVVGGLWLPHLLLRLGRHRRLARFEAQFAPALDALASALQAGLSLPQGLALLSREMPAPLSPELAQVVRELGIGLSLEDALDGLLERLPLTDVEIFVTAVQLQYRVGGNLSTILRSIANTVRERQRIRGEVQVLTAQQRLGGYIITGVPVLMALALAFINPTYIGRLFEPGLMRVMLTGAILGALAGFFTMKRITDIEV